MSLRECRRHSGTPFAVLGKPKSLNNDFLHHQADFKFMCHSPRSACDVVCQFHSVTFLLSFDLHTRCHAQLPYRSVMQFSTFLTFDYLWILTYMHKQIKAHTSGTLETITWLNWQGVPHVINLSSGVYALIWQAGSAPILQCNLEREIIRRPTLTPRSRHVQILVISLISIVALILNISSIFNQHSIHTNKHTIILYYSVIKTTFTELRHFYLYPFYKRICVLKVCSLYIL